MPQTIRCDPKALGLRSSYKPEKFGYLSAAMGAIFASHPKPLIGDDKYVLEEAKEIFSYSLKACPFILSFKAEDFPEGGDEIIDYADMFSLTMNLMLSLGFFPVKGLEKKLQNYLTVLSTIQNEKPVIDKKSYNEVKEMFELLSQWAEEEDIKQFYEGEH